KINNAQCDSHGGRDSTPAGDENASSSRYRWEARLAEFRVLDLQHPTETGRRFCLFTIVITSSTAMPKRPSANGSMRTTLPKKCTLRSGAWEKGNVTTRDIPTL